MNLKTYQPLFLVLVISVTALVIHKLLFAILFPQVAPAFVYSLVTLYGFFYILSTVILLILIKVSRVTIDNFGFLFISLTTFKIGIAYFFLRPILKVNLPHSGFEKANFLFVFLLFLAIETIIAVKILNNKQ